MASKLYDYTPTELQKLLDESSCYKELLRKIGMCDHGNNYSTLKKVINDYNLDLTKINQNREELNKNIVKNLHSKNSMSLDEILVENSTYKNGHNLKNKLFKAGLKEKRCEKCGLIEWQGQPIPLQLHHKNGVHNDNRLKNLEILCPNCHALTENYAGKNIKKEQIIKEKTKKNIQDKYKQIKQSNPKVSKEELFEIIEKNSYISAANLLGVNEATVRAWHKIYVCEERKIGIMIINSDKAPSREELKNDIRTTPFTKIGEKYGVTDNAVRKWCDVYKLPRKTTDIKKISDEDWIKI